MKRKTFLKNLLLLPALPLVGASNPPKGSASPEDYEKAFALFWMDLDELIDKHLMEELLWELENDSEYHLRWTRTLFHQPPDENGITWREIALHQEPQKRARAFINHPNFRNWLKNILLSEYPEGGTDQFENDDPNYGIWENLRWSIDTRESSDFRWGYRSSFIKVIFPVS